MQFQVPQFIDIEDKLFGPLTFKQFAYLVGGAGMIFIVYKILPFFFAIILIIPIAILALALAFYKINGKPFVFYMQAAINYTMNSKLYVWKQRLAKPEVINKQNAIPQITSVVPKVSRSKLSDISWNLDVTDQEEK